MIIFAFIVGMMVGWQLRWWSKFSQLSSAQADLCETYSRVMKSQDNSIESLTETIGTLIYAVDNGVAEEVVDEIRETFERLKNENNEEEEE